MKIKTTTGNTIDRNLLGDLRGVRVKSVEFTAHEVLSLLNSPIILDAFSKNIKSRLA